MVDKIFVREHNHNYYLVVEGKKSDPLTFDQLKEKKIDEDDLVWRKGLNHWVKAKELEELSEIIEFNPPPIPLEVDSTQIKSKNSSSKINKNKGIVVIIGILLAIFIFLIAKEMNNKSNYQQTNEDNAEIVDIPPSNNLSEENLSNNETVINNETVVKEVLPSKNKTETKPSVSLPENYYLSKNEKVLFVFDAKNKYWWSKILLDDPREIMPILTREEMDYIYNSDNETAIGGWQVAIFDFAVNDLNKKFNKKGKVFKSKSVIDTPLK
jgi:hypothetical protein